MLATLIWKDFRLVRLILVISAAVAAAAFPFIICMAFFTRPDVLQVFTWSQLVIGALEGATMFVPVVSYMAVAFTAGGLIAGERQDRTADFLATLPPIRSKVVLSKAIIAVGTIAACLLVYAGMKSLVVDVWYGPMNDLRAESMPTVLDLARVLIGCGGVAWAVSSVLRTITIPVLAGFVIPGLFVAAMQTILYRFEITTNPDEITQWISSAIGTLGILGFVIGSIITLRRESP